MAPSGRFSANGFHTSGVSQIRLCRENKVTLLPWTDMGHSLKCLSFLHVGLGERYNNLPPDPLPLANAILSCTPLPQRQRSMPSAPTQK